MLHAAHTSPKRGAHVRQDNVQNTAFGDAKNPEGFVKTWRTSSRAWRARAVLCAFLSLLLLMMQPTGNALYRSWNAATGEAQGLGVAFATGEEDEAGDLVPATLVANDVDMTAQDGERPYFINDTRRVFLFGDWTVSAPRVDWYETFTTNPNTFKGLHKNDNTYPKWARQTDTTGFFVADDRASDKDSGKVGVSDYGNMGALTYLGDYTLNDAKTAQILDWTSDALEAPYSVWALGYTLADWKGVAHPNYWETKTGVNSDTNITETGYPYGRFMKSLSPAKASSGSYEYSATDVGGTQIYTEIGNPLIDENSTYADWKDNYLDTYLFARWTKRNNYQVSIVDSTGAGSTASVQKAWDSTVNVSSMLTTLSTGASDISEGLGNYLIENCSWAIGTMRKVVDNRGTAHDAAGRGIYIINADDLKKDVPLGKLLNPGNSSSPDIDPFSTSSPYFKEGGADYIGWVSISPSFVLTYDANGGTGGSQVIVPVEWTDGTATDLDAYSWLPTDDPDYTKINASGTPQRQGYKFLGWSRSKDATTAEILAEDAAKDSLLIDVIGRLDGNSLSTPDNDNYYEAADSEENVIIDSDGCIHQNVTLYAVWQVDASARTLNWELVGSDGTAESVSDAVLGTVSDGTFTAAANPYTTSASTLADLTSDLTIQAKEGIDSDTFAAKYGANPTISWKYYSDSDHENEITELGETVTTVYAVGTPALETYDVTANASQGVFKNGSSDFLTTLVVSGVPYGTAYDEINFDLSDATTSDATLTVSYDKAASNGLSDVASAGAGTHGTYSDASGNTNTWTGSWSENGTTVSDLSSASVSGTTTLTYTYDEGYNVVRFALDIENGATNATADATDPVASSQSIGDLELSSTVAYVAYANWTPAGIAAVTKPTADLKSGETYTYSLGDKYATTSDKATLTWSEGPEGTSDAHYDTATSYTYTAQPTLRTFEVTLTIAGTTGNTPVDKGGFIKKKWDGEPLSRTVSDISSDTNSTVVGKVAYGDYAKVVVDDDTVVNSVSLVNNYGYTKDGATWEYKVTSAADTAYASDASGETAVQTRTIQVTQPLTFRMTAATKTFPVTVEVNGGTFNQLTPANTEMTASFVITGVPYNTAVTDIKYNTSTLAYDPSGASLASPSTLTAGDGRNTTGSTWSSGIFSASVSSLGDAQGTAEGANGNKYHNGTAYPGAAGVLGDGVTLTYEFGRDDITVNYKVVGGTWGNSGSDTITGTVPYGKTIADGTSTISAPPDPTTSGAVTVTDINQYFDPSSTAGTWDTTPTAATTILSTSPVTYTYTLATRNDLTVSYTIPSGYTDIEFASTSSYSGLTYDSVLATAAAAPTAIQAKNSADSDMVAKKYNLIDFGWKDTADSSVTSLPAKVVKSATYEAQITLKDYSVEYSIVNGTWGSAATSSDSKTDYHYGNNPSSTNANVASLAVSGNTSDNMVSPNSGYAKSGGAWEGVWEMRVSNDGKQTWTDWAEITGTPSAQAITGDTQFRLTLKRVVSVTFTHDGDTISSGFTDVGPTEYFAGDTLTAPTVNDSSLTAVSGYEKTSGSPTKSGHWTTEVPATVPDSATALTYTYALYPVYTATYYIVNGEWDGTWHGNAISGTSELSEELFSTESVTAPGSKSKNASVYNLALAWYEGANVTSGTAITPSGTLTANASYTAYYGSSNTYTYKVNFYQETVVSAQAGGTKTTDGYARYKTWTSAAVAPGTKVGVTAAILAESGNAPTPTAAWTHNATLSDPTLTIDNFTVVVEGSDVEFNVYYDRNLFDLSYAYTYDDSSNSVYAATDFPTPTATASVPYGAALSLSTAESVYATSKGYLTFDGWYDSADSSAAPSTMPASALALTGAWSRNAATITLVNNNTTADTKGNGTISAEGYTDNNIEITGYKYGDAITWPTITKTPATSDTFFGGWKRGEADPTDSLPSTVDALAMTFEATWSTGISIQYLRDADDDTAVATFAPQMHNNKQPATGTDYVAIDAFDTTASGAVETTSGDPNYGKPAANPGYVFQRWEWTENGTTQSSTEVSTPKTGNTSVPLTFRPVYEGTTHGITYDVNGGTQNTSNANALTPGATGVTKNTGDTIYLPSSTELTRTGCTLSGYLVKVGSAEAVPVEPGNYTVPAGATASYTDAIEITAQWTTKVTFEADAPAEAGLGDAGITNAIAMANAANTAVALGSNVSIPTVSDTPVAQVAVAPGYHFDSYTADTTLSDTLSANTTSFTVPSASTDTFPSTGITVTAKWAIDAYTVNWEYSSETVYEDAELNSTTASSVKYGTAGSAVQGSTAPTLRGKSAGALNEDKYTAGSTGIDWYLKVNDTQTNVKLGDITFGTPFWYDADGTVHSEEAGSATAFTWTHGDSVTFVAVPKIRQYTITVAVSNGTMTDPTAETATTGVTSVAYTQDYGTKLSAFLPTSASGHAFSKDAYDFTADSDYVQSSGRWSSADPFSNADAEVTESTTYTYEFPTKKSYIVKFEIGDYADKTADGLGLSRMQETTNPEIGTAYNAASFPTLTWSGDLSAKYETALTWMLDGNAVSSGTYADSMVTGTEADWPKTITFVGTPQTKTYTVRVTVEGGSFQSGVDGVVDYVKTITTDAVYGKTLDTYLPTVASTFERDTSGNMATGHWERVGARGTVVNPAADTVQYTDATYVYVFDTMRTVTFKVNTVGDGGFDADSLEAADGYYTKTYYVSDGKKLLDIAEPSDATGAKTFADEAALQAMYKLKAQGSEQGYEWNTTGWAGGATLAGNTQPDLTTAATGIAFPNASAAITGDVTYTYDYAPKAVSVKFVQMFQDATGDGYSQVATSAEGPNHSATWTGTYSTDPVTIANWSGRLLDGTDTTLFGYKAVPVKATSDAAGTTEITEFTPTNFSTPDTYYLWYDRITVNYSYSYTNTAPSTANGGATPAGGSLRWGASANLASVTDSTYAQALNAWYTTNLLNTLAAAPGAAYTFEPVYTYSNPPESVSVTLYGSWITASYPVTFANAGTGDPNDDNAKFVLNGVTGDAGASATTGAITYDTEIGSDRVPEVLVTSPSGDSWAATSDKYSFTGWNLYIDGTPQTDADGKAILYSSDEVAAVKVMRSGYVFKPVFKLNQITIRLAGGGHQDALDGADGKGIAGYTAWTVDYGTKVKLPNATEWQSYRSDTTGVEAWLDGNSDILPSTEDQYAVRASSHAYEAAAWVNEDGNAWPSTTEDGHYVLEATENHTYQYQWTDYLYVVHYMNVGGSTSNINALAGKQTTESLKWGDSVFGAKLSDASGDSDPTVLDKWKYTSGTKSGMAYVLYPEWSGHTFLGWQQGSAAKAGRGTIAYPGNDITISAAYNPSYVGANVHEVYLWALWQGDSLDVKLHKNAGETTETPATQAIEIDVPTNLKAFNELVGFARDGYTFNGWVKEANKAAAWSSVADGSKWADKAAYTVQENASADDLNLYANWTPNTYKVQFAYFDGTPMTVKDVTGSGSETDPYQQTFTYDETKALVKQDGGQTLVNLVNAYDATHNPGSDVFAGWSYNGSTLADGAEVSNLTTENNGVVTLTPIAAKSVKLTYEPNAGTDSESVTGMPSPLTASALVIDDSANAMNGYASFTLPNAPSRTGYNFQGWKVPNAVDASKQALSGNIAAGTTIYLSGTYAAYLAYAQWEAQVATTYTIERQVQSAPGSNTYTVLRSETKNATSGTWVEIGAGDLATYSTDLEGYTYMPGLSTTGIYVAANGTSKIILKYNVEGHTLSYAFTEGGLPLTGDAAGSTPFGTGSTVTVTSASPLVKLLLPNDATLPEGYQIASGYGAQWNYDSTQNSLKDSAGTSLIATSTVAADGTTQYKVVDDTTLTLPIEKSKYTVTFALGEHALWNDGSSAGTVVKQNVVYGTSVDPDAEGATTKPVATEGYGFGGWKYHSDVANDPLEGTIVDPATTAIKGNVTFTANYYQSHTVTWSAGGHSASGFSHTPESQRLFTSLPPEYLWESDGTSTRTAGLQLDAADLDGANPKAEDGYTFDGWVVNGNTAAKYASLEALYAAVSPNDDYTIEAQWAKITQTVLFDPNVSGGGATGQIARALQGLSGEGTQLDGTAALTPNAPDARAGYEFSCWQLGDGATAVQLGEGAAFTFPMNPLGVTTTYVAQWDEAVIDIQSAVDPTGKGTIVANRSTTGIRALSTDVEYTLKANPQPGYKFVGWTTNTSTDISSWYRTDIADKANGDYGLLTIQPVGGAYQAATYTAHFAPDPYEVTFENSATPGEGEVKVTYASGDAELVNYNDKVKTTTVTVTASTPGYRFLGWTYEVWPETADANGVLHTATEPTQVTTPVSTEDLGTVPIIGRTVFTAKYAKNPATLTYDKHASAATGSIGQVTGKETGDTVTLPSSGFTWAGHSLLGWLTADKDGTGADLPSSMTEAEFNASAYKAGACGATYTLKGGDETLYAVYKAETATLVYDNNAATVTDLAKASSKSVSINANEDATALAVAAVNWENGDTLATQPGYVTDDASATRIPGAAREFVGWSFDKNAVEGGSSRIFAEGEAIPASYLPAAQGGTATIYAIWKDKLFTVSLNANGGRLMSDATAPSTPLATGVRYGDTVPVPELMYERTGHTFRYWLADDGKPTRVSDSSGAAASYKFIGTSDVTLTAQWYATGTADYKVTLKLVDEKGSSLTGDSAMGPYTLFDTPLTDGAYEDLSVVSSSPLTTANTGDYFTFDGWYIYNQFLAAQKVGTSAPNPRNVEVADIVKLYDGTTSGLPTYWNGSDYTDAFNNGSTADNLLTLYAKKSLKAYDISFDPHIPDGSGYEAADVAPIADIEKAKVSGETRSLSSTYSLPGYTFLGWLKSKPNGDATTTANAWAANADAVAKDRSLAQPLLSENSTDYQVTLYAAWADTDNKVTLVSAYPGDGVIDAGATADETILATQEHKTWKDALDSVTNPTVHADNEYAIFTGWYTEAGVPIALGTGTGQCSTVADIVAADPSLTAGTDGSYDIKLYARYSFTSARVVYFGDADATAPVSLPVNQAVEIPTTGTDLPAATITPHVASATPYQKAGFHMDGWEGRENDGTYNNTTVAGGYYNKVWRDVDADRAINFDYDAAGMVVKLYPHFTANSYTVNYSYDLPTDYSSYVMSAAVPGKDSSNNNVMSATGLGLTSGSVYARDLFATDPVLEGYELTGWTYTTPGSHTVTVEKGWTVEDLLRAAAAADGTEYADAEALYADTAFALKAVWTPKTYSVAYNADGGVLQSTGMAPGAKTDIAWDDTVDSVNERLLIEASKLSRDGYSNPVWYADSAKTVAANSSTGGDMPTFGQLVYLWHQANNHASGTNVFDGSQPLTLYAGWTEDTANVFFTVSDAENGWISSVAVDGGATTSYNPNEMTQLSFAVGAKTGKVTVSGVETTIDKVTVTADTATGYGVSGWTFGTDTVASTASYAVPTASRYVGGIYEALIEGNPNAEITLRYFDMDATGAYPSEPSATSTGLKASDFLNDAGSVAKVGDVIPAANLGAVRTGTPAGLALDTGALADYTVKASGNTVDLYFARATVDVSFAWEWPGGQASATPPALPDDYLSVYYGSTQNTPAAPTAPTGYVFDGWYAQGSDTALGATFTVDNAKGMTVVGKFSKATYEVKFTGVYAENGTTVLTGEGIPTVSPAAGISTTVAFGSTVGTAKKILLTDTAGTVKDVTLGMQTGAADLTVSYDSSKYAVTWVYSKDGGTTWVATADPTKVAIEGATEFRAVASGAQVVSYLAGEHGAFATSVDAGTRATGIEAPYDMADYLYDQASADGKKSVGVLGSDGLPLAEAGWRFAGWSWEYTLPSGYPQTGSTPELGDDATPAQKMHAGVEDLAGLEHGIVLTALWEPAESYLKLDLNDSDVVYDETVRASWASGYGAPEGLQQTYDPTANGGAGNAVVLPDADQVVRNGFTLKGWKWTVGSTTYELAPGASFQMPASDKTTSDDPAVTLTAKWEEDYVTINYHSNDNAKGTVSVSSETVGTWTGKVRGGTAALSGSKPTANEHFSFTKWTRDSLDGVVMTEATGRQPDNSLVPQRNTTDKRYDAADYYVTFTGDMYYVTFKVDDASVDKGTLTVSGFSAEQGQQVPYSASPVMSGTDALGNTVSVVAKPKNASYDFADGRYWDYYTRTDSSAAWVKKGSTTDPSTVKITAETQFRVNFKESTGTYPVHFDVRGGIGSFDDVYKAWGDANVGAGKTPRRYGYSFTGWYATPYGQNYASATEAAPGMMAAVSSTYGQLAGGDAYAAKAAEEGIWLLAGWSELGGFAITLNGNGGTFDVSGSGTPTNTAQLANLKWTSPLSSRLTAAYEPSRPGYRFTGWSTTPSGAVAEDLGTYADLAGENDAAPGSVVLYAQWAERTYTVRYMNWPRSNNDPITANGDLYFDRELKYTDVVATAEPYNSKSDDRVWNAWAVITGSSMTEPEVELSGANAGWTVASLESNDVEGSGTEDDPYIVYGTWTSYISWTTTYVLYDDVYANPGTTGGRDAPGDDFDDPRIPQYLTVTDKGLPGQDAVPNMVGHIPPGFELNEPMTVTYNNNVHGTSYATTSDMHERLTATTVSGTINFDVVVVAKTGYSLAFDLNDDNISFPGGYSHKAVPSDDVEGTEYPTQVVKDFYKIHNVPWSVYATDNTEVGVALGDPTRDGFAFDGWYNLVVKDNEEVDPSIDIKADEDMYYGDLAFDAAGNWYDPMVTSQGVMTLYARWAELTRTVHYVVAEDMKSLVKIRLQSEAEGAFSTEERTEVIGAATGDSFVDGARAANVARGAVAQANRGYSVVWRIVPADTAALSKTYEMPLGETGDGSMSASSVVVASLSAQAAAIVAEATGAGDGAGDVADDAAVGAPMSAQAETDEVDEYGYDEFDMDDSYDDGADFDGVSMSAQAEVGGTDTAMSSEGKVYQSSDAITPAVEGGSDGSGLFVGAPMSAADTSAMGVLYVATVTQKPNQNIIFNTNGADTYSGPARLSQPAGTFVGETASNGVWGVAGSGSLPDRNSIRRVGYVFDGWTSPSALTYLDADGNPVEIPANTVIVPGSWAANHLVVPEGGLTLAASWSEGETSWVVNVPDSTNPNTGEVVPGTSIEVPEGGTLTNDQIAAIVNRGGAYPDKWDVTYYDVDGVPHSATMTIDELIAFLQKTPVVGDMTIAPAADAKWGSDAPTIPDNGKDPWVRPAKDRAAKTGDTLVATISTIAGIAFAAAAVLFLLLSLRRRRE